MYIYMNWQLCIHNSYLLCGFMTAHRIYFYLPFVLDSSWFLFLMEDMFLPFESLLGAFCLFSENHNTLSLFFGSIFQILFLQSTRTLTTKSLRLQVNKHIHTSYSQQMTKVFRKLLVYTKLFCTKLMLGINMHYLHMQKDIHIHFSLILSMFYKYYT